MALHWDDNLWSQVKPHAWKYRRRTVTPRLIEIHATRSGIPGRTAAQEYTSTKNWFLSATNYVDDWPGVTDDWASMASAIVGGGKLCMVLPEDVYPHYSLGHADYEAFSLEIAQATNTTPFLDEDLDLAAAYCADISERYNIPVRVLPYLSGDNHEAPGYVRHDRSANGTIWGKTDPGDQFDDRDFEERVEVHMGLQEIKDELAKLRQTDEAMRAIIWNQAVKQTYLGRSHKALQGTVYDQAVKLATHEHEEDGE